MAYTPGSKGEFGSQPAGNDAGYDRWLVGAKVLLWDTNPNDTDRFKTWLMHAGASVTITNDPEHAHTLLSLDTTDLDIRVFEVVARDAPAFDIAVELRKRDPGCKILFTSSSATPELVGKVRSLRACFLSKPAQKADFMFSMSRLVEHQMPDIGTLTALAQKRWSLSPQQTRLLYYNLWSCSNEEIAQALQVSLHTVQEYQQHLRKKTGARTKSGYLRRLLECAGVEAPCLDTERLPPSP